MDTLKLGIFLCCTLLAIHKAQANELDKAIISAAHKYKVPVRVLRAIAEVESSGGRNSKLRKNRNMTYDTGPLQINSVHWSTTCRGLDVSTVQGNADCGALLLARHYKRAQSDPNWFAAYHSKTPSLKSQYATKVRKILQLQTEQYKLYTSK